MITPSIPSTAGLINRNSPVVEQADYSRHLSMKLRARSTTKKSPRIIRVTIRSPKNNRCLLEEKNKLPHSTIDLRSVKANFFSQ